jgi:FAD/FMN-containing dehydrogenase
MEVLRSGDPGYEAARKPAIARFHDVRPAAVVRCRSADDVGAALAFAREADLPVAVRSGGHCFAGRSSTTGVVIDVAPMDGVAVAAGEATIGAGARLGAVYEALDAHGVTIPAGCGTEVGVSGLTLGGGLGLLGRMHGLTSDRLIGAEVVLADGGTVAREADHDSDLLWALRGAGAGGFGVVTALRFATLPAPAVATRLHAEWPVGAAAAVAAAWQEWAPDGPDELAATLLLGGGGATITGAYVGPQAEAEMLMAELAAAAGSMPAAVRLEAGTYHAVKRALAGMGGVDDALAAGHAYSRSELFDRSLPADAIAALVEHLDTAPGGAACELDLTPMAGAYNRVAEDATAFAHRGARFVLKHTAVVAPDADPAPARDWVERSFALVHPWGSGRVYPNFAEPDLADWPRAYHAGNLARLREVKARYDPDDVFRGRQTIRASGRAGAPIG